VGAEEPDSDDYCDKHKDCDGGHVCEYFPAVFEHCAVKAGGRAVFLVSNLDFFNFSAVFRRDYESLVTSRTSRTFADVLVPESANPAAFRAVKRNCHLRLPP
jgi:hypothetical protein